MRNGKPQRNWRKSQYGKNNILVLIPLFLTFALPHKAEAQAVFEDISEEAGFADSASETWGASWGDINGDLYPDIYISNHRTRAALFRNTTYGTFEDVSQEVDLSDTPGWTGGRSNVDHHGASWADVDNDGDDDLYLIVSSDDDHLLINDGGLLTDRSADWKVDRFLNGGDRMPIFVDFNGDGLLDLAKISRKEPFFFPQQVNGTFGYDSTSRIAMDCTDASFGHLADVNPAAGLELLCGPRNGVYPKNILSLNSGSIANVTGNFPQQNRVNDVASADFNGDLRPDLFAVLTARPSGAVQANDYRIETQLLTAGGNIKNVYFKTSGILSIQADMSEGEEAEGDPRYIDIGSDGYHPDNLAFTLDPANPVNTGIDTNATGLSIGFDAATSVWRIRQEGNRYKYSYLVIDSDQPITGLTFEGETVADRVVRPQLFMNYPGGFVQETVSRGLGAQILCTGAASGDFDNDMDTDLFLTCTGGPENIANILYDNKGDGTFVAVAGAGGAAGLTGPSVTANAGSSETAVTADYDLDGFLDIFVTNGNNMRPIGLGGPKQLFRNMGNANNWLELDLHGITSNRDGVGAIVLVTAGGITQYREQNGGYHRWSQNHKRIHVGLGSNNTADISVQWPNGDIDLYPNVNANALYELVQGGEIHDITPNKLEPQCGKPDYDRKTEKALFVWQDCSGTGQWRIHATAGGSESLLVYGGYITADAEFSSATSESYENGDVLTVRTAPPQIDFTMKILNTGYDGISVGVPEKANACLNIDALPEGAEVYLGAAREPAPRRLNLDTADACESRCHDTP